MNSKAPTIFVLASLLDVCVVFGLLLNPGGDQATYINRINLYFSIYDGSTIATVVVYGFLNCYFNFLCLSRCDSLNRAYLFICFSHIFPIIGLRYVFLEQFLAMILFLQFMSSRDGLRSRYLLCCGLGSFIHPTIAACVLLLVPMTKVVRVCAFLFGLISLFYYSEIRLFFVNILGWNEFVRDYDLFFLGLEGLVLVSPLIIGCVGNPLIHHLFRSLVLTNFLLWVPYFDRLFVVLWAVAMATITMGLSVKSEQAPAHMYR